MKREKKIQVGSFNFTGLLAVGLTVLLGACSSAGSIFSFSYFSTPELKQEDATIAWLVPEDMLIAFNMAEGYDIKNRDAVLILRFGDASNVQADGNQEANKASETSGATNQAIKAESFKLIKMPPKELKNLGEAANAKGTAYFRFDTDDYERVQALVDMTQKAKADGKSVGDSFGLASTFCREGSGLEPLIFSTSILFSKESDANNLPKTRAIVTNRMFDGKDLKRC